MGNFSRLAAAPLLVLCSACAHLPPEQAIPGLAGAYRVYTLTNLHPDEQRSRLYAANFQQPGLIPICSEVTLVSFDEDELTFRVEATGKNYEYFNHDAGGEPLAQNLTHYFGIACPTAEIATLTEQEREALRVGSVVLGMRRGAVILAIGYPPLRSTPSLESPRWHYWHSRFNSFMVEFSADGKVMHIQE